MKHFRAGAPNGGTVTKGERLIARQERRDRKAQRKALRDIDRAERRAQGLKGAPIADLPEAVQGLARTLTYGDVSP